MLFEGAREVENYSVIYLSRLEWIFCRKGAILKSMSELLFSLLLNQDHSSEVEPLYLFAKQRRHSVSLVDFSMPEFRALPSLSIVSLDHCQEQVTGETVLS